MTGIGAAARLGWLRARRAPGRWLGVAVAVALAVAALWGTQAAGTVAGDHAARAALGRLSPAAGRATLSWNGGAGPAVDAGARRALRAMGAGRVTHGVALLPARIGRTTLRLAGVGPLDGAARVLAGRLPRGRCLPARCEVLRVSGTASAPRVTGRGLRLVTVGRGALTGRTALGFTTGAGDTAAGTDRPLVLVSGDPTGVENLVGFSAVSRTHGWSAALPLAALHAWQIPGALDRLGHARAALGTRSDAFSLSAPEEALAAAGSVADAAPARLRGVTVAVLAAVAAFLVLAAVALRGGMLAEQARLRRTGATAAQRGAAALTETGVPVLFGWVLGVAAGLGLVWVRARTGAAPVGHVLGAAAGPALVIGGLTAVVGWGLVLACALVPDGAARRVLAGALLAVGAGLVALLTSRPPRADVPLAGAALPLAAAAGALLVAVMVLAGARLVARLRVRSPLRRLALLELARAPGLPAVAAAALALSTGLGMFALAYRFTLEHSRADRADQRVPVSAILRPGRSLRSPAAVRSVREWKTATGATAAWPVLRHDGFVAAGPTRHPAQLLGLPAEALPGLPGTQPAPGHASAARLHSGAFAAGEPGVRLPPGAMRVGLVARATGDAADLSLYVRTRRGTLDAVALGTAGAARRVLTAPLSPAQRGGLVVGVGVRPPVGLDVTVTHQLAEGGTGPAAVGRLALGPLQAGGHTVALRGWSGHGGLRGAANTLRHEPGQGSDGLVRPPAASDRTPVPVLADPATARDAALSGTIDVAADGATVPARVVGVLTRLPTVAAGERFVVGDARVLQAALDARSPGTGAFSEVWLSGAGAATARLAHGGGFALRTHAAVRRALDRIPVEREALRAVGAVALLALLLGVAGVALAVRRTLRDEAPGLADLEAQGVGPADLRRGVRLRSGLVAAAGVLAGVGLGAALAPLAAPAVRAALGAEPDPAVAGVVPWGLALPLALGLLVLALAVVTVAAAAGRRGRASLRAEARA